jgi:hypothetical protein
MWCCCKISACSDATVDEEDIMHDDSVTEDEVLSIFVLSSICPLLIPFPLM